MTPDSEGLHEIANTTNRDRKADIVFVHGLGGASHTTWRHGKEGKAGHFFWPEELGKDLPDCGIWSVGYPAGFTGLGKQGMIIEKRAGNVSDTLANAGLGDRPIFFITHSMGGLVVKHLIVDSQVLPGEDRKRIVGRIRGIVFCGTPHKGSAFADAARVFGVLGGGSQAHVKEMCANTEKLDLLHDKFVHWHGQQSVLIDSYAENRKLCLTRWLFSTDYGVVVPRPSANAGIFDSEIHDLDDDHLTLVKPRNRKHNVYVGVLRFIRKALFSRTTQVSVIHPQMRIERGIRIELVQTNPSDVTVLSWDLPTMTKRFGARATQYSSTWKKIHAHSEWVYDAFRMAHLHMILCHARKDHDGGETATPLVESAVSKFRQFTNAIETYPNEVAHAEHLVALQSAEKGFSALFWHLSNSKPGTDEFMQAVLFVERVCAWCFETLSRADRVLEKYFETRSGEP